MRALLRIAGLLGVALPAATVSVWLLTPAWRRVEHATGVEALGHSGPAAWCYGVVYASWVIGLVVGLRRGVRRRQAGGGAGVP